ncbi:MAG: PilZ domain-containing protein [Congregibacter sp.]|nr:PilZ domain-containing protein [Congregibacter sp.]
MTGKAPRRFFRLPVASRVFIEIESPPPGSIGPGKVARCDTLDVSQSGLRVRLTESVTVGAILQIGVELPGETEPFYLVGQVRWRMQDKENPGSWIAGFEILNALGSDIQNWEAALMEMDERTPAP